MVVDLDSMASRLHGVHLYTFLLRSNQAIASRAKSLTCIRTGDGSTATSRYGEDEACRGVPSIGLWFSCAPLRPPARMVDQDLAGGIRVRDKSTAGPDTKVYLETNDAFEFHHMGCEKDDLRC